MSEPLLHVTFVCSGNICRSPMAEKMFAHQIRERGLADVVRVSSAGTGGWHAGDEADDRANRVLRAHGYPTGHRAAQVCDEHLAADLVIAAMQRAIQSKKVTYDFARLMPGATQVSCSGFGQVMIEHM